MTEPDLAKKTLERATSALKTGQLSTMPEIVQLVHTLSSKDTDISVQELAELVKRDPNVLAKVIMVANGFGFNPNGIKVETVSQAIQVIGFERIRTLAMSLLLVEQTNRNRSPAEQREAAAHALCSGFIAESVADAQRTVAGESAFVCAALRHFGRIVMTSFMTEEYRRARGLVEALPEDEAFRKIFGLTPLELGHELLRAEQLPEEILATLRTCDPASVKASSVTPEQRLLLIADFSTQLCELIFTENLSAADFAKNSSALVARFAHALPGLELQLAGALDHVQQQFSRLRHGMGVRTLPIKCVERLKDRATGRNPPNSIPPPAAATVPQTRAPFSAQVTAAPFGFTPPAAPPPPKPTASSARLRSGLDHLAQLAAQPGTPADVIHRTVIEVLSEAFAATEVYLLLRPAGLPALHLTHGLGRHWRQLQSSAIVTPGERTTFGLCLTRRENLLIHDAQDAAIAPYMPAWLRSAAFLQSYVLLPIVHADQPLGILLAGWATKRKIILPPEQVQLLRDFLALVARKHTQP